MFSDIKEAVKAVKNGEIIIIVDDKDRENEGDLVIAAEKVTPKSVNFMITHGRGLVCMPISGDRLDELVIPLMTKSNTEKTKCQFTVSVDHKDVTTGISAHERALTIKKMVDKDSSKEDFLMPGHIFPLRYTEGGVLKRPGHTEAAVDLARLADLFPAAVICEIIKEDGTMARRDDLKKFSEKHNLKMITINQLKKHLTNIS